MLTEEDIRERAIGWCETNHEIRSTSRTRQRHERKECCLRCAAVADVIRSALAVDHPAHPQADVEARLREIEERHQKAPLTVGQTRWLLALARDQAAFIHDLREDSSAYQWGYREGQEAGYEEGAGAGEHSGYQECRARWAPWCRELFRLVDRFVPIRDIPDELDEARRALQDGL